jgi:hypothetical protein
MTTALAPAPNGHREASGRFLKGNPGGPGNPYVKQVAALKASLYEALTPADIRAVMAKMRDEALAGSVAAARLLLEYSIGRPLPGTTASVLDAQLAERLNYGALTADEMKTLLALVEKMERSA